MRKIANSDQVNNFLRYLILHGVSKKSIKFYKSDLNNFLSWSDNRNVDSKLIREFVNSQTKITPPSTLNRRLSTLRAYSEFLDKNFMSGVANVSKVLDSKRSSLKTSKFFPYKFLQDKIVAKFDARPKLQSLFQKIFFNRPNWYRTYHTYPVASYIHMAILVLFCTVAGYAFYDQVINTAEQSLAYPSTPVAPNKYLSFQGRLTNNLGNPITTARDITFKLYTASSGGTTLWDSTACSITPDGDGIFSTLLGSTCGGAIDSTVFSENASVWVGVTVGADAEATPRIQIATVAYALNSETLQGFPLGTGASTVPYLNSSGELVIAAASPKIQSTSGTFAVEGVALTLTTPNTSDGIITINPDGTGTLDLTFEGAAAGGSANGFINATNANITSGALYGGTVASSATGYNFIDFQSGVFLASKFSVNDAGNITTAGDLVIGGGNINPSAALTIGDNGDTLVIDSSDWDIDATGAITGVSFDANGTGNSITNIESADIADGTISEADLKAVDAASDEECLTYEETTGDFEWQNCGTSIGADSLDFTDFSDTMSLDADTSIAAGAGEEITYNKAFTNDTSENGFVMNFTASDTGSATTAQYGLYLNNVASTEGTDALLVLNNADDDDAVGSAILFTAGGAGTDFTYGINFDAVDIGTAEVVLENAETIDNQTDGTITLTATTTKTSSNLEVAGTSGINLSGIGGDITFANAEKIDNDTDGTITLTTPTTALTGDMTFTDNNWLGLGSSAGLIEFDDQTTDEVNILNANVGIGTSTPAATLDILADASTPSSLAFQVGLAESSNLIADNDDSDFDTDTGNWTGTNWAVGSGVLAHTAGTTNDAVLANADLTVGSIKDGQAYRITYTISGMTNGGVIPKIGTATGTQGTANGTYTDTIIAVADDANLIFTPDILFNGNLDTITLTRVAINTVITDAGRLGIGRSSPSYYLDVLSPDNGIIARFASDNSTGCALATSGTLSCTSDVRLKKNINDVSYGLDTVMNLRAIEFDWSNEDGEYKNLGFIAQEVERIIPNLVSTDKTTGYKQLNQIGLIPVLTRAIQDLATRFETKEIKTNLISPITNSDLVVDLQPDNSQEASKLSIKGENDSEVASIDATGKVAADSLEVVNNATVAGTLYADRIESLRLSEIEDLLKEVESNQAVLSQSALWEINTSTSLSASTSGELIANSVQTRDLFVTNQAAMTSLFVSDNLTTKSINSLDSMLSIQSLAAMPVEIMAGKVKIDTEGNVYFSGNVEVAGDLTVNNLVVANSDSVATESAQINSGEITTNAIAGKAILPAGQTEIKIINPKLKNEGLIYVTPVSSTQNKVLYVKSKDIGTFTVGFNEEIDTEVEFNWWIIDLENSTI